MNKELQIVVRNRDMAGEFDLNVPYIVISVTDVGSEDVEFVKSKTRKAILRLKFSDFDPNTGVFRSVDMTNSGIIFFDEKMAKQIVDFIKKHSKVKVLLVHCEAGISRSPGIAAAICNYIGRDDSVYFSRYLPNMYVYSTILKILNDNNSGK